MSHSICCTLREDLLEEVALLAQDGQFDYLVIESTGISEPMQVAEAFTSDFWDMIQADANMEAEAQAQRQAESPAPVKPKGSTKGASSQRKTVDAMEVDSQLTPDLLKLLAKGGLAGLTRLDTVATVIDAFNFFANFDTAEMLTDRYGKDVDPEDERNITELMV